MVCCKVARGTGHYAGKTAAPCLAGAVVWALVLYGTPLAAAPGSKFAPPPVVVESLEEGSGGASARVPAPEISQATPSAEVPVSEAPVAGAALPKGEQGAAGSTSEIRPASFLKITPGLTLRKELAEQLGSPSETMPSAGGFAFVYRPQGLEKVEVQTDAERVRSIIVHLSEPAPPADVARDLGFDPAAFAPVPDEEGHTIGWALPERAVLFAFAPEATPATVSQVVLEEITAEPFLVRAAYYRHRRCQQSLADLATAEKLGGGGARLHALRAELLGRLGNTEAALANISEATRLDPISPSYVLTKAWLLGEAGDTKGAVQLAHNAIAPEGVPDEWKARGECLLGDLLAQGRQPDVQAALEHHRLAIQMAKPLVADLRPTVRREARQVLIDANLGVAADIAAGQFRNKHEAVREWLRKASDVANEYLERDAGPDDLRLSVYCGVLRAYALAGGDIDPAPAAGEAIREGQVLIGETKDPLTQRLVEWQLGLSLMNVARFERNRGRFADALRYAHNAAGLVASGAEARTATVGREFTLAQMQYLVGSIHAVGQNDHSQAVLHYQQAQKHLGERPQGDNHAGEHGEMLVSMGVSYWEAGRRDEAVQITQQGATLVQQAIERGLVKPQALAVPYGNLASMHADLNQPEQARHFEELANRLTPPAAAPVETQRR